MNVHLCLADIQATDYSVFLDFRLKIQYHRILGACFSLHVIASCNGAYWPYNL